VTSFHAITNLEAAAIQNIVPNSSVNVIPNGLDRNSEPPVGNPDEFDAAFTEVKGKFVILYLARLHQIKGGDILINAFAELVENHPNIHLVMAGRDSGFEPELRRLTTEHSLAEKVTFTGHVTGSIKESLLARANLYVLPSRSDAVGYATLEAMLAELPVVITDQCGAPDVAHSGAGIEAEATVDSIRDALDQLISNDELRLGMGKLGAKLVASNYDAEKNAERMIEFYRTVTAEHSAKLSIS